mmetsp:Transcript_58608/g.103656  ORF Transcript_58608/g.103656 Transcript_58608/m.103656 type:complete len:97 (+) Transcript_58608:471-761(+)
MACTSFKSSELVHVGQRRLSLSTSPSPTYRARAGVQARRQANTNEGVKEVRARGERVREDVRSLFGSVWSVGCEGKRVGATRNMVLLFDLALHVAK